MEDVIDSAVAVTTTSDEHATARVFLSGGRPNATSRCQRTAARSGAGLEFARGGCSRWDVYATTTQLRRATVISVLFVAASSCTVAAPSRAKLFPLCES